MARRNDEDRDNDEESRFLESYDPSAYERLSVAIDVVLLYRFFTAHSEVDLPQAT